MFPLQPTGRVFPSLHFTDSFPQTEGGTLQRNRATTCSLNRGDVWRTHNTLVPAAWLNSFQNPSSQLQGKKLLLVPCGPFF